MQFALPCLVFPISVNTLVVVLSDRIRMLSFSIDELLHPTSITVANILLPTHSGTILSQMAQCSNWPGLSFSFISELGQIGIPIVLLDTFTVSLSESLQSLKN
jgi:hypothetical protein